MYLSMEKQNSKHTGADLQSAETARRVACTDKSVLLLLAMLAAVRVGLYTTVFPLFNHVDEFAHYDHVVRWSQGEYPRRFDWPTSAAVAEYVEVASPEYLRAEPDLPPRRRSPAARAAVCPLLEMEARGSKNHELLQPPLYYAVAGFWRAAWQAMGLPSMAMAYAVRLLNMIFIFLAVLVAGGVGWQVFPQDRFSRLALPALVAIIPQDAFYGITNDVLSPLLGGAVLWSGLSLFQHRNNPLLAVLMGLFASAAIMSKLSNIAVVIPLAGVVALTLGDMLCTGWDRRAIRMIGILGAAASIPLLVWVIINRCTIGELSGGLTTAAFKGWTPRPLRSWLDHPLFTSFTGFPRFLQEVTVSMWRGEFVWHGSRMASFWADLVYTLATFIGLAGAIPATIQQIRTKSGLATCALIWSWLMLITGIGFLIYISVSWDFGPSWIYPSRYDPVLRSGRLILGALIPFCLLLVAGLNAGSRYLRCMWVRWPVLLILLGIAIISELVLTQPVWRSPWNAFHLL